VCIPACTLNSFPLDLDQAKHLTGRLEYLPDARLLDVVFRRFGDTRTQLANRRASIR